MSDQSSVPKVYAAINAVQRDIGKIGISKDTENKHQHFMFRGIDAVYGAISPLLAAHRLVIVPRYTAREVTQHKSSSGGTLFYVVVKGDFDFVSCEDGSKHTASTFGEAMDSGDKATNKAESAAYKYVCFQTFCIPTEGDNDAEATTHDLKQPSSAASAPAKSAAKPSAQRQSKPKATAIQQPSSPINAANTRKIFLHKLAHLDGQGVREFFIKADWILPTENIDAISDGKLPTRIQDMDSLVKAIAEFCNGGELAEVSSATKLVEIEEDGHVIDQGEEAGFWDVKIGMPPKGADFKQYRNNPDTIRSLWNAADHGDESASKRLWFLSEKWEPREYKGAISPADIAARKALDEFLAWKKAGDPKVSNETAEDDVPF